MKIRPLYDRVVVKRIEVENKSKGGIVLTTNNNKSTRGEIIAIGKGRVLENGKIQPLEVKIGDIIIFNDSYGSKPEIINNNEIIIISESEILAIIE